MPEKKPKKQGAPAPKKQKKKKGGYLWVILGVASIVFFAGIIYLSWEKPSVRKAEKGAVPPEQMEAKTAPPAPEKPAIEPRPKIVIMIDDMGNSKKVDDEVLSIDAPLTVAVFPLLSESRRTAEIANSNGKEVLLHLPMEPKDYPKSNPGRGALLTSMDDIAIVTQLYEDIKSVPGIKGINNHMGSKFTEDKDRMRIVLMQMKDKDLFFVDSKTSPKSHNEKMAREIGIKAASRDVFLDNEQNEGYIEGQIQTLKMMAVKHGSAIGIGHPHPATIAALKKAIPEIQKEFDIVHASEIVR